MPFVVYKGRPPKGMTQPFTIPSPSADKNMMSLLFTRQFSGDFALDISKVGAKDRDYVSEFFKKLSAKSDFYEVVDELITDPDALYMRLRQMEAGDFNKLLAANSSVSQLEFMDKTLEERGEVEMTTMVRSRLEEINRQSEARQQRATKKKPN